MSLYDRKAWKRRSRIHLAQYPLCVMCLSKGILTAAQVADHIKPHNQDPNEFFRGKLQSLCVPCHNRDKQKMEAEERPRDPKFSADGWPVDEDHPVHRATARDLKSIAGGDIRNSVLSGRPAARRNLRKDKRKFFANSDSDIEDDDRNAADDDSGIEGEGH